jgi:hypothetical protein
MVDGEQHETGPLVEVLVSQHGNGLPDGLDGGVRHRKRAEFTRLKRP